jgi:hypothetical protein
MNAYVIRRCGLGALKGRVCTGAVGGTLAAFLRVNYA